MSRDLGGRNMFHIVTQAIAVSLLLVVAELEDLHRSLTGLLETVPGCLPKSPGGGISPAYVRLVGSTLSCQNHGPRSRFVAGPTAFSPLCVLSLAWCFPIYVCERG